MLSKEEKMKKIILLFGLLLIGFLPACGSAATPAPATSVPATLAPTLAPTTATTASATTQANASSVEFVAVINNPADPIRAPGGLAVDNQGNLYVADMDRDMIQKFDSNGKFLAKWGSLGQAS